MTNCPRQVHQSPHNHQRMDKIYHGKASGDTMGLVIPKSSDTNQSTTLTVATLKTKGSFTRYGWTQLIKVVNNADAHHICSRQFVSLYCCCESCIFQHEQTCWRIFRCICKRKTMARALHRNGCEEIERQECRYGTHAVSPSDNDGGDSKREELCQQDPEQFTIIVTGASSSSGRPDAMKYSLHAGEGKVYP